MSDIQVSKHTTVELENVDLVFRDPLTVVEAENSLSREHAVRPEHVVSETGEQDANSPTPDDNAILRSVFGGVESVRVVQSRRTNPEGGFLSGLLETYNIFTVDNASSGTVLLRAEEYTEWYTGRMMGVVRPFTITFQDVMTGRDVFTMRRTFPTSTNWVEVCSNNGTELFGSVSEYHSLAKGSVIVVRNAEGQEVAEIPGTKAWYNWDQQTLPPVGGGESGSGQRMGNVDIVRAETGSGRVVLNSSFPPGLEDPKIKAVLLSAVFLSDFMYYEKACN